MSETLENVEVSEDTLLLNKAEQKFAKRGQRVPSDVVLNRIQKFLNSGNNSEIVEDTYPIGKSHAQIEAAFLKQITENKLTSAVLPVRHNEHVYLVKRVKVATSK
jgi:hypothetical protein